MSERAAPREGGAQIATDAPVPGGTSPPTTAHHDRPPQPPNDRPPQPPSYLARLAAGASLILAAALVALMILSSGPSYRVTATFSDASGLVPGDDVLIGPARAGTVESIGLTADGEARVTLGLDQDAAPLHAGTVAWIREGSLSGIASHYIVLYPGPAGAATIGSGGEIPPADSHAEVGLDQLFDTLDPLTRAGIRGLIRGEADAIRRRSAAANRTIHYLAPALASAGAVTRALAHDEPAFDGLLVEGARTLQALASRSVQLTQLVAGANTATGAIAQRSQALAQALALLPNALTRSTTTFAGLRATLDALDPLVNIAKPAARRLEPFSAALREFAQASLPTLAELAVLIHSPPGDLTQLLQQTPALARAAAAAFPALVKAMNTSQPQLDYLREYTPDVVAALTNLGQAGAYYDANGHYERAQPYFGAFGVDASNQLASRPPSDRTQGLQVVHGRCPGGAVQPTPDGSAPNPVSGCNPSTTPPGP